MSEEFPIMTGVRQGDVVSPLLFNIVIDVMRKRSVLCTWKKQNKNYFMVLEDQHSRICVMN
uniref:Reverse transcriptase domain-containing protein n=1 Tax=Pundamilia nyererei TaxID=303518 RepID=A0A3B4EXS1_9CICH